MLDKYGILLIDDEVICGFGRTGYAFGAEAFDMRPATMSVAKSLTSAYLPLSAVLIPGFMYEPMIEASGAVGTFGHGYTYSGHPGCAAVALRTLGDVIAICPPLIISADQVDELFDKLESALNQTLDRLSRQCRD